jgi:L-alanine-DL-glutamate epimerase-like enolase superfamily enzyme
MLPEDLAGHRGLQQAPGCPIALGEHFRTELQVRDWVELGALQVLQPDIGRTGFVMGRRMRQAAQARGIAVTPHMGSSLDVMHAATLNFAAAWADPSLPCEYQAGLAHRLGPALRTGWRLGRSGFEAPDTPGIGVEVDEEALQAFVVA